MKSFISRKDSIILSAIDIINEHGIQGLSTKEIAARQEVNESALYRHFKSKDAIIDGVLEYFSQFDDAIYNSTNKLEIETKDKIKAFVRFYLEYYEGYPAITGILFLYESLNHDTIASEKIRNILDKRVNNLEALIKAGQDAGELNDIFTSKELAYIIFGFCNQVILQWRISCFKFPLKEETLTTLDKLMTRIFNKND